MELPLETIYLYGLIICGALTILYLFLGDALEGIFDFLPDYLNPALILSFLTFLSAGGFLLEKITPFNSLLILLTSIIVASILSTLLNIFVLIPLASAEESLVYSESDLKGRIGKVIISIPKDGYGEVLIEGISGTISKPAQCFDNEDIAYGAEILVIDVKNGVLYVSEREKLD